LIATILLQASPAAAANNERLAIILGLLSLSCAVAVFASCRTCRSLISRLGIEDPGRFKGYSLFYQNHIYYWWAFGVLLVAHFMVAVLHTGLPQAGDPDANSHWLILGLGIVSAISAFSLFSSCRVLPRLVRMATPKKPLDNLFYRSFNQYHNYYWIVVACLAVAHFIAGFAHSGIWPSRA
jgi:hypothetical protein